MVEARRLLVEITESKYIPFTSPAPCSTEVDIKMNINGAIARIEYAIYLHDQEFTRHCRKDDEFVTMTIKQE